jgi:hypothetical protein
MVACIVAKIAYEIYHVFWFCLRGLHSVPMIGPTHARQISMKYTVCLKGKCTDFPMDELEM